MAGSYLAHVLANKGNDVEVFEASQEAGHWPVCAWAAAKHILKKFSEKAGLRFDDYIYHEGKTLKMELPGNKVEYLDLKGLVTYNKRQSGK